MGGFVIIKLLRIIEIIIISLIILIIFSSENCLSLIDNNMNVKSIYSEKYINNFEPGDILFFHDSRFDGTIWNLFYWTHCCMYIDLDIFIWACDTIREDNLSTILTYFNTSNWAHLRVNIIFDKDKLIDFAEDCKGQPFDMISLYLMTKQVNPPRWHFGYGYYCTELIWASYLGGVNINLDPNLRGWITPLEIYYNKNIEKIFVENPNEVPLL